MKHASQYQLYGCFGDRYDMHTPRHHYQHDHAFVIEEIQKNHEHARLLDIGCGSGVFLEKALQAGLDPIGLDPAAAMLQLAREKVGEERLHLMAMQDLEFQKEFHAIVSLSWSLNYAANVEELTDILRRIKRALLPGGQVFFQIAHAPHAPKAFADFFVDQEPGLGDAQDITFKYRFATRDFETLLAQYQFHCHSTGEYFEETHLLNVADAEMVAQIMRGLGFKNVKLLENHQGDTFQKTFNPFLIASLPFEK
jgi:ubiquinone/menaquinone biosynthesis C-methylase UbiE